MRRDLRLLRLEMECKDGEGRSGNRPDSRLEAFVRYCFGEEAI